MKLRLNTYYWMSIAVDGIILLVIFAVLLWPLEADYRRISVFFISWGFIVRAITKLVITALVFQRGIEGQDERDIQIENKAANCAIRKTEYTIMALIVLFQLLQQIYPYALEKGILLGVFGVFLPEFFKNCYCLYYEKHGNLE